ncbi:MAG: TIGR01212 family radical SAM protein [Nitrospirae bacterium]|nr:TIGR01212 family radical SAM protein [Nitrospirota bacterium]
MSRHYFSYNEYLKKTFPFKVYKIPLDAGFTCPNRDGALGYGGCIYCENKSFSPNSQGDRRSVSEQIARGIAFYKTRRNAEKFIAYFQAYTNTYAPVTHLKALYDEALTFPEVVGLSIGTRPDCVSDEALDLLADYARRTHLWVEFGLQTIYDQTLDWVHRGHTFAQFEDAVRRTKARGLPICVHVILGFPGETREMMLKTAETLAALGIDGIKIHHLYVAEKTLMEKIYRKGEIPVMDLDDYVPLVCDFLERIPDRVAVQRLMGELDGDYLVAPRWGKRKQEILAAIEAEFQRRGTRQGSSASQEPAQIAAAP